MTTYRKLVVIRDDATRQRAHAVVDESPIGSMMRISPENKSRVQEEKYHVICGIYAIRHIKTGKIYVGSSKSIRHRFYQHSSDLMRGVHNNKKLQNAWKKYGKESFEFIVLEVVDESLLIEREQYFIDCFNAVETGYNLSRVAGRERFGISHTKEAIERMSMAHKGKEISKEHRAKLSAAFKGIIFSDEHRAKISAAKTGKKRPPTTDQARKNYSAAKKGIRHSPETRAKLSAAHKGKVMSEESRRRMSISQRKRYGSYVE